MISTPFEDRVVQLKAYTDSVNKKLESAQIPYFEDGTIRMVTSYIFEEDRRSTTIPAYDVGVLTWQTDRNRVPIDNTLCIVGKQGETVFNLAPKFGITAARLIELNHIKPEDENKDLLGVVLDTGIIPTVSTLSKLGIIKPLVAFLDGLFIPMSNIRVRSDIHNDYLFLDLSCIENVNLIRDRKDLKLYTYKFASDDPNDMELIGFDKNGMITSVESEKKYRLYTRDTITYKEDLFVDSTTHKGTFGHMFNERVDLPYMNKVKPENVFVFQEGRHITNATVTTHNYNIINVRFPDFGEDSRAVCIYRKSVFYTEDNALRVNHAVAKEIAPLYEDFLDDTENSVQRFIDEICLIDPDRYGIKFVAFGIDNAEEGSTPADELIYYTSEKARRAMKHLAGEIFQKDKPSILQVINGIIDDAYVAEFEGRITYDEWHLRKNLPEMFKHSEDEDPKYYDDYHTLDESFDFKFYDKKSMNLNMLNAIAYIANYDSDKLESALPRYEISACCDGSALRHFVSNGVLKMGRFNWTRRENYVMIFKNGELLNTYNSITYEPLEFKVPIDDFTDDDKFEIVYILMVNNRIFPVVCNDSIVTSMYWFDKDEVELWDNRTPDGSYAITGKNQVYRVPFTITDPWVRAHAKPQPDPPTPGGGGVDFRNGPIFHFDDSDLGYDAVCYITNDHGLESVQKLINTYLPAATYPDVNELLMHMADVARNNNLIFNEMSLRLHLSDSLSVPPYPVLVSLPDPTKCGYDAGTIVKCNNNWYVFTITGSTKSWQTTTKPADADAKDPIDQLMAAIEQYSLLEPSDDPEPDPDPDPDPDPPLSDWWLIPDDQMYKLRLTDEDLLLYEGDAVWITSCRQFRHQQYSSSDCASYSVADESGTHLQYKIRMSAKFRYCTNVNKYMVFINNRCLPRSYIMIVPRNNNPVGYITLYPQIPITDSDVIDVFYLPDEMTVDFNEEVLKRKANTNSGYIKIDKSSTLTGISRNSSMIFVNGRKIRYDEIQDISTNIVKVTDTVPNPEHMTLALEVYRYLYSDSDFTLRAYAPSKLEELIPPKPSKMDDLFASYTEPRGTEQEVFLDRITKDSVRTGIKSDADFIAYDPNSWVAEF